jgi:hypothetical protein
MFKWGFAPYNPTYFFALMQKSKQKKNQDCARLLQKTIARKANPSADGPNSSPPVGGSSNRSIFAPFSLVFWLTERGQSQQLKNSVQLYASRIIIKIHKKKQALLAWSACL